MAIQNTTLDSIPEIHNPVAEESVIPTNDSVAHSNETELHNTLPNGVIDVIPPPGKLVCEHLEKRVTPEI